MFGLISSEDEFLDLAKEMFDVLYGPLPQEEKERCDALLPFSFLLLLLLLLFVFFCLFFVLYFVLCRVTNASCTGSKCSPNQSDP